MWLGLRNIHVIYGSHSYHARVSCPCLAATSPADQPEHLDLLCRLADAQLMRESKELEASVQQRLVMAHGQEVCLVGSFG